MKFRNMYKLVLIALNKLIKCPSCKQRDAKSGRRVPTALAYPIGPTRTNHQALAYLIGPMPTNLLIPHYRPDVHRVGRRVPRLQPIRINLFTCRAISIDTNSEVR